jgi:uncharacterized protein YjbJ (UPF0337 family)
MNKDQVKGKLKQAQGQFKKTTGKIIGNKTLENEGRVENATGKMQENYGDVKKAVKDNS